jgi:hypothetical protein
MFMLPEPVAPALAVDKPETHLCHGGQFEACRIIDSSAYSNIATGSTAYRLEQVMFVILVGWLTECQTRVLAGLCNGAKEVSVWDAESITGMMMLFM